MLAFWLLAAHLTGDFLLQSRWQAAFKQQSRVFRATHVTWYTLPFVAVALTYSDPGRASVFLLCLAALHYLTDSRRYLSTPGDILGWRIDLINDREACRRIWMDWLVAQPIDTPSSARTLDLTDAAIRWPPPNPWPSTSFAVDQSLHIVQVAVLAAVFLV